MINRAWLAGFFDGEGCIYLQMSTSLDMINYKDMKQFHLQISITQKDRKPLDLIQSEFGGKVEKHLGGKQYPGNCHRWRITASLTLNFLEAIQPYSIVKREQIDLAIQFVKTIRQVNLGSIPVNKETNELRSNIHDQLKKLKGHG